MGKITETKLRKIIRNLLIENKFKGGSWRAYEMKKKHYQNRKGKDAYEEVDGDSLVYDVSQGRINAEELANKYSKDELISAARDAWHLLQQNHPLIRTERELKRAHGVIEDALAMMGVPEEE